MLRRRIHAWEWLLAHLIITLLVDSAGAATLTGKAEIFDGDTIKIGPVDVRLEGIDAFEDGQLCQRRGQNYDCGKEATKALASLIAGRTVQCEIKGKDRFDRFLAVCTVAGTDLNRAMVREGWALAFVKYSGSYVADEQAAHQSGVGAWAAGLRSHGSGD